MALSPTDRPMLWRLARMQYDEVRQQSVLQYPEGVVLLNESGAAILELCDGKRTLETIGSELSATFGEDVRADVTDYLDALADRGLIRAAPTEQAQ